VRVSAHGLGCPEGACGHGQFLPGLDTATRIEWFHRSSAWPAAPSSLAPLVALTFASPPHRPGASFDPDVTAGVLYVLQAGVAVSSSCLELPAHLGDRASRQAEILLAVLTVLGRDHWRRCDGPPSRPWTAWLLAAAVAVLLMLTGAYVRGADATNACTTWLSGDDGAFHPRLRARRCNMAHRWVAAVRWRGAARGRAGSVAPSPRGTGPARSLYSPRSRSPRRIAVGAANPLSGFLPGLWGHTRPSASLVWCLTVRRSPSSHGVRRCPHASSCRTWSRSRSPRSCHCSSSPRSGRCSLRRAAFRLSRCSSRRSSVARPRAGGASALNHYSTAGHRRADATYRPPSTAGAPACPTRWAVGLGIVLNIIAFAVLAVFANVLAGGARDRGHALLHPPSTRCGSSARPYRTSSSVRGRRDPAARGWAAVTGSLDLSAWLLFAIVFFWTPGALPGARAPDSDDYKTRGGPDAPVVRGEGDGVGGSSRTRCRLVPLSVLLFTRRRLGRSTSWPPSALASSSSAVRAPHPGGRRSTSRHRARPLSVSLL